MISLCTELERLAIGQYSLREALCCAVEPAKEKAPALAHGASKSDRQGERSGAQDPAATLPQSSTMTGLRRGGHLEKGAPDSFDDGNPKNHAEQKCKSH